MENFKKVTIIIVTWNSQKFLPDLFNSIRLQDDQNFESIVIDNNSSDDTYEFSQKNYPEAKIVKNEKNIGFAKAYNLGIKLAKAPYVLICNHDIILGPNFLTNLLKVMEANEGIASVGGKLLKYQSSSNQAIIDSSGIVFFKSRRAIDRGENEEDKGQFEKVEEVFGISGALVLYRKSALEKVSFNDEYFDEDFFAYKEDVDLAWRLRLAGFKAFYIPKAVAYHKRATARKTDLSDQGTVINRRTKSREANYLSYRNHLFLLVKNEKFKNIFFNPFLCWYELKKIIYLFFQETSILTAWLDFFKKLPIMIKKRKKIKEEQKISNQEMIKWFN